VYQTVSTWNKLFIYGNNSMFCTDIYVYIRVYVYIYKLTLFYRFCFVQLLII